MTRCVAAEIASSAKAAADAVRPREALIHQREYMSTSWSPQGHRLPNGRLMVPTSRDVLSVGMAF